MTTLSQPPTTGDDIEYHTEPSTTSTNYPTTDFITPTKYGQYNPVLFATTGRTYDGSILESHRNELLDIKSEYGETIDSPGVRENIKMRYLKSRKRTFDNASERNVFKTLEWTPDGTSIVTTSEDDGLRLFYLPPNLPNSHLKPYSLTSFPSTIYSTAVSPRFNIADYKSTLALVSTSNQPIRFTNLLAPTEKAASFPLVDAQTERFLPAYSLLFPHTEGIFMAGSESRIALFDVNRDGQPPYQTLYTTPSKKAPLNTTRMKGLVSTMSLSCNGILAAGTFGGSLALYDAEGCGSVIAALKLPGRESQEWGGQGVTSLAWSLDGSYLYVLQRKSEVVLIYDVRNMGGLLDVFTGVKGMTNQRIGMQVAVNGQVLVGGDDGWVRVWDQSAGSESVAGWEVGGGTVTGVGLRPGLSEVATCSGRRRFAPDDDPEDNEQEKEQGESEDESEGGSEGETTDEDESDDDGLDEENEGPGCCLKVWTLS
ncbi:WD40 repeat-like protein [Ascobolus immersus RN42]|uniref:WD40 repeat-like protein n=1 Tax=Ascobolus immersus RN42 TaxID=1160509 RepID=A0A3N4IES0_ASCIM|nr:WD40 repeat-like protein [Ascobolus immersus RN42]